MALDEELIDRGNQVRDKADDFESNAPDYDSPTKESAAQLAAAFRLAKKNGGGVPESQGDLRADKMAAKREQGVKAKAGKVITAALSPAKKYFSGLLQQAWINLIETFGLTLLWIDIHVFLNLIFGDKIFCNLGEEWIPENPAATGQAKK